MCNSSHKHTIQIISLEYFTAGYILERLIPMENMIILPLKGIFKFKQGFKMTNKLFLAVMFSSSLLSISPLQAQQNYDYRFCNSCTATQMKDKARNAISNGQIHIVDINNETVKKYNRIDESEGDFVISLTTEIPADSVVEDSLDDMLRYADWLNTALSGNGFGAIDFSATIQPHLNGYNISSAHQLTKNQNMKFALQAAIAKWVSLSAPLQLTSIASNMGTNFVSTIAFTDVTPANTIRFPDGTTYQFKQVEFIYDTATGELVVEFELIEGSGRDGDEPIPEGDNYAGLTVSGSTEQIGRYVDNAPANTTVSGYSTSNGGTLTMTCDAEGDCVITYTP